VQNQSAVLIFATRSTKKAITVIKLLSHAGSESSDVLVSISVMHRKGIVRKLVSRRSFLPLLGAHRAILKISWEL